MNSTRPRGRPSSKSASLFDHLAIDDGRGEAAGGRIVEAVELGSVDQEEAPVPGRLAGRRADFGPEEVVGEQRDALLDIPQVSLPLDLEEPDRDPDRVLVRPHRGQVHHLLHHLRPPVGVLAVVGIRAIVRTQVNTCRSVECGITAARPDEIRVAVVEVVRGGRGGPNLYRGWKYP